MLEVFPAASETLSLSDVPEALSIASEAFLNESEAPFDAFSLSYVVVIVPCFVSIFHMVLTNCVCFNTTSKPIELERPTASQIKDNFKRYPTNISLLMFQYS